MRWLPFRRDDNIGNRGERLAARFLKRASYRVLGRNLSNRFGEVDLLVEAPDRKTIVIVEVKSGVPGPHRPEVHVNAVKQRKLVALGAQIARHYRLTGRPLRFDVVGITFPPKGKPEIRHHIAAFDSHV